MLKPRWCDLHSVCVFVIWPTAWNNCKKMWRAWPIGHYNVSPEAKATWDLKLSTLHFGRKSLPPKFSMICWVRFTTSSEKRWTDANFFGTQKENGKMFERKTNFTMYGIFTYIYHTNHKNQPNEGKYTMICSVFVWWCVCLFSSPWAGTFASFVEINSFWIHFTLRSHACEVSQTCEQDSQGWWLPRELLHYIFVYARR